MQQLIKRFSWVGLLVFGLQGAWAFSLGGPFMNNPNPINAAIVQGDAWQTPDIAYGLPGDVNGPKNLGEEYRRNLPVMYYTCDANFLGFFGSNGVAAVDSAFAVLNGLTNVDSYSPDLSEFPMGTRHLNFKAQALGLYDLKTHALGALVEQLGLADPVRYDWAMHDRITLPNTTCPFGTVYLVAERNFDTISTPFNQLQYSPYINNVLYSYYITEFCTAPIPPQAFTVPFSVDPLAETYTPVAANNMGYGIFYTGLTRDDVAGLRYLLAANNINYESAPAGSILQNQGSGGGGTSYGPPYLLYTSNYTEFASIALTNDQATLTALYPGLVVASSVLTNFLVVVTTNYASYFTNQIGAPYGSPPILVFYPIYTYNFVPAYANTFDNVIITNFHPNSSAQLVTVTVGVPIGSPVGSPVVTNPPTIQTIILPNVPSGEYYIDTNLDVCGATVILSTLFTNVVATTNLLNVITNSGGYISQSIVTYSTTHVFMAKSPICANAVVGGVADSPRLREGIEKMRFVRADYDSLLSQTFQPITYSFTTVMVTNSQAVYQTFTRVVTAPDFIFSAADIAAGPNTAPAFNPTVGTIDRSMNFDQANALPGLAGPGVIPPATTIIFDKVGPVYYNYFGLLDGTSYFTESPGTDGSDLYYAYYFVWASFDGTTNDPVLYPNGNSIQNMENQILVQLSITPASDVDYTASPPVLAYDPNTTFSATGGAFTPPYTWSASGLPAGLSVTTTNSVGKFSGAPTQSGTFPNFVLKMTDNLSRSVQWTFSITIP